MNRPVRILFIHQNFPGQFKHLAPELARIGHEVRTLTLARPAGLPGISHHGYKVSRGTSRGIHPWASEFETKILRGEACARAALELAAQGFRPDVICAHPGWGESLFLREVWPAAKQLHFVEFHYASSGLDVGFDPEFGHPDFEHRCRVHTKNASGLLSLSDMDWGLTPTQWQKSTVPTIFHPRLTVIHDGIDTRRVAPRPDASFELSLADGSIRVLRPGDEVVTFVNRNLEPSRGYHRFMRALPALLEARPGAQVLIVGGDEVSYGARPAEGSYKERFLDEVRERIDVSRVHFLGRIPYPRFLSLLQVSAVHVYLTYPFVLSWSMLEAMSAGALVIASRTAPVTEVLEHGRNGLLCDFHDSDGLANLVTDALDHPAEHMHLRQAARQTIISRYDLRDRCLPAQVALVQALANGSLPA